jgi:hypothetical protein
MVIQSFSYAEYLMMFTAFIYGYVATRFFSGWRAMINHRHSIRFSLEHLVWTLFSFGLLIYVWWGSYNETKLFKDKLGFYYLSLASPLAFYLISMILFPAMGEDHFIDLEIYFDRIRKRIFLALAVLFFIFQIEYFVFKDDPAQDASINGVAIALALVGCVTKSRNAHRVILFIGWTMLVVEIALQPPIDSSLASDVGFSFEEYLTTFTAFIYGFIASRFFSGWGAMISKLDKITFSKEHLAWTVLLFCLLLDMWTGSWQREQYIVVNIRYFMLSLLLPIAFYALGTVAFPFTTKEGCTDLKRFFESHKKPIYLNLIFVMVCNSVIANTMEEPNLMNEENYFRIVAIGLSLLAIVSKKTFVERTVLALGWIVLLTHAFL